jgi:hypothetical protein
LFLLGSSMPPGIWERCTSTTWKAVTSFSPGSPPLCTSCGVNTRVINTGYKATADYAESGFAVLVICSMNVSQSTKTAFTALALGIVGITLYCNWETIVDLAELIIYDSGKAEALQKLRRIQTVLNSFRVELDAAENSARRAGSSGTEVDSQTKNAICGLSMDLDFVFSSLDKVHGDEKIKAERKRLINEFEAFVSRVDALELLVK